jgi:hypothetical protein
MKVTGGRRQLSVFFGASKKLQNYQIDPFVEARKDKTPAIMLPDMNYRLKMYWPKRQNVLLNWISLRSFLNEDRLHFLWVYDQLLTALQHPNEAKSQLLMQKFVEKSLRDRL